MSTNRTSNYNLNQWVKSDRVLMEEFNADNAKIDAALAGLNAGKVSTSALNALQSTVNGNTASLAKKGNCILYTTSYTGNGQTATRTLTFPGKPQMVVINGDLGHLILLQGTDTARSVINYPYHNNVSWTGNSVSWSHTGAGGAAGMMNTEGATYAVVALIKAD